MIKALAATVAGLAAAIIGAFVAFLIAVTGGGAGTGYAAWCATDTNLAAILTTIRDLESGGDYTINSAASTASGAYQFVDPTWDGYGGYNSAADAPPHVQDQKAADAVRAILAANSGDVSAVPASWYIGHVPAPGSVEWDTVPAYPANTLTPREYQTRWIDLYTQQPDVSAASSCALAAETLPGGPLPDHLDCGRFTWGGYPNGGIPLPAMRYRPHSATLHPAASATYDQLYAAAQQAGFDLRAGEGYRARSPTHATAGTSCHGLGLAVDITILVTPGPKYSSAEQAFAGPEIAWICANAETYGWITPRWALPAGFRCGTVIGNGRGGHRGDRCCFLEPWHLEAAGIVATHPDFTHHQTGPLAPPSEPQQHHGLTSTVNADTRLRPDPPTSPTIPDPTPHPAHRSRRSNPGGAPTGPPG